MSTADPNTRKVTVCSACLTASCWHYEYCCEQYRTANTTERTVGQLRALALEHPSNYSVGKVRRVCGDGAVEGYEQFEGIDEAWEPCVFCGKVWGEHARSSSPNEGRLALQVGGLSNTPSSACLMLKAGYQPRRQP